MNIEADPVLADRVLLQVVVKGLLRLSGLRHLVVQTLEEELRAYPLSRLSLQHH